MPNAAIWFEMFNILISKALNYPVDLYYLMDLSNSMSDDRENVVKVYRNWEDVKVRADQPEKSLIWILIKLVKLGGELAKAIEAITPDYQIGWVDCSLCPFARCHSFYEETWRTTPISIVTSQDPIVSMKWPDSYYCDLPALTDLAALLTRKWCLISPWSRSTIIVINVMSSLNTKIVWGKTSFFYVIFRRTTARKRTAQCLTGEALYSG